MKSLAKLTARLLVLLLLALLGAVIYLDVRGFPAPLKDAVERQFLRAGYAVNFSEIRLDVLRGMLARDARVADARAPDQLLARIDNVELQWNWRRMMRGENAIHALRIANAAISVPTPPDEIGAENFSAEEAYATFRFLDDGTTAIDQLSGVYAGIRVQMSGSVKPRAVSALEPPRPPPAERSPFGFVTKALRELHTLQVSEPPQLDLDFDIDLGAPLDSRVKARLVGKDVGYRQLRLERAAVDLRMRDGGIDITEFRVELGGGEFSVRGRYDIAMGRFDLRLDSSLDPADVVAALPEILARHARKLHCETAPIIQARYVLSHETGSLPLLTGSVRTGALEFREVAFRAIQFQFENQGYDVKIADAEVLTAEGRLTGRGQINVDSSDFAYEVDSTLDPRKLLPLMTPVMREIVEPSWFETPPHIVASVSGDFVDPDGFAYDAELNTARCSYRGVPLAGASATMQLRQSRLRVPAMTLTRDEGELRGALTADFNSRQVSFDIQTTANPTDMAPLLGPKAGELMRAYRFGPRTQAAAAGMVDLEVPGHSAWSAEVSNEGFSYWKLRADRASARLTMKNNALTIYDFDGDFYGGKLRGWTYFALDDPPRNQFEFNTERCDLRRLLTDIAGKETEASGLLTGYCVLQGEGADLAALRGHGSLSISDGVLWEMPLFGIFSRIMDGLSPGLGRTKATDARASFTIQSECVRTEDLKISAGAFTLSSPGRVCFDGKLDFRVQAQFLRGVPLVNIPGWFIGKIFEYKIGGTIGDYSYRPVNLPKEILPHSPGEPRGN